MQENILRQLGRDFAIRHPRINPKSHENVFRKITSHFRMLPDFLIIGAQKAGTTSLYNYIVQHPDVVEAHQKEVMFFDENYFKGINWYKSFFPINITKKITGEATVYYLYHPLVPKRVYNAIPSVKLIVLLRNPVDRAYSHYHQQHRRGWEDMSFEDATKEEEKRLDGEEEKINANPDYVSYNHKTFSYLDRGIYVDQIERWFKFFPKEQFLILDTNELENYPQETLNKIFIFLRIREHKIKNLKRLNVGTQKEMNPKTREYLLEYFRPYNQRLEKLLSRKFDWDN